MLLQPSSLNLNIVTCTLLGDSMSGRDYLGEFEHIVLLALNRLGPSAHGASIHREILERTGRDVSIAAVYVTLKRMEKKGLVHSVMSTGPGRTTRDYTILPAGHDALARSRALLERLWDDAEGAPA